MALYKRGKVWWISYAVNDKRVQKPISTKKEAARTTLENIRYNIRAGRYAELELAPIPFGGLTDKFLEWAKVKKSYDSIKASVSPSRDYFEGRMAHEITEHEVEAFRAQRKETPTRTKTERTNSTCNHELVALKQIFNKGIAWGLVASNPAAKVKPLSESKGRTRFLPVEEVEKLLDAASRHLRPILVMALETGMRRGEILSLRWSDVDMKAGMLYIGKTKNNEARHVPMSNRLRATLAALPRRLRNEHVFTGSILTTPAAGKRRRPLNQSIGKVGKPFQDVRTSFENACTKAGITGFRFHDLRHTAASHMIMAGVPFKTVGEILGHKTATMTERYSHLTPEHKRKAVETLSACYNFATISGAKEKGAGE